MRHLARLLLVLVLATAVAAPLRAAPQATALPSAFGGTIHVWHDAPATTPWATVILFPGGDGRLGLGADGAIRSLGGNFLVRTRQTWLAQGLAVLIPDAPDSLSGLRDERARPEHAADIAAMVRLARQLHPAAPVWLIGTSNGTVSAANGAAGISSTGARGQLAGLVLTSPVTRRGRQGPQSATVFSLPLAAIAAPSLVVAHQQDECAVTPPSEAPRLRAALTAAPRTELLLMDGGLPATSGPCEARSAHGFLGIENDAIARITTWMRR